MMMSVDAKTWRGLSCDLRVFTPGFYVAACSQVRRASHLGRIALGQSSERHGEKIQTSGSRKLLGWTKGTSMRKERRVGEIKFRPVQAGSLIDIVLYKGDALLSTWASGWRWRHGTRVHPCALARRSTRAPSTSSCGRLAKKAKHLGVSTDEGSVGVHVHVRATTDFCESVLNMVKKAREN